MTDNTSLFNAYKSGLKNDRIKENKEKYEQKNNTAGFYDGYLSRLEAQKLNIKKETEERYKKSESQKAMLCMYRSNKNIIHIWEAIAEEISNRISGGIAYGPPKKLYVEFKSENHNVTAVVTRNDPTSFTNGREVIYTSNSYEIPGEFNEEVVVKVLTEFCNENLYGGQRLIGSGV